MLFRNETPIQLPAQGGLPIRPFRGELTFASLGPIDNIPDWMDRGRLNATDPLYDRDLPNLDPESVDTSLFISASSVEEAAWELFKTVKGCAKISDFTQLLSRARTFRM